MSDPRAGKGILCKKDAEGTVTLALLEPNGRLPDGRGYYLVSAEFLFGEPGFALKLYRELHLVPFREDLATDTVLFVSVTESAEHLVDTIAKTRVLPTDAIVFKSAQAEYFREHRRGLLAYIKAQLPHWRGLIFILREDEDFYTLSEADQRTLYAGLKEHFG